MPGDFPGTSESFAGPANRARLFDSARFLELGYKSKASDLQQLLPLLGCLLEMLDTEKVLRAELCSYQKLFQIHKEVSRLKALDKIECTQALQRLQTEHHIRLADRRYSARNTTGGFTLPNS